VQFQAGEIGPYTPNNGESVSLPASRVLRLLPPGSLLRRALTADKR